MSYKELKQSQTLAFMVCFLGTNLSCITGPVHLFLCPVDFTYHIIQVYPLSFLLLRLIVAKATERRVSLILAHTSRVQFHHGMEVIATGAQVTTLLVICCQEAENGCSCAHILFPLHPAQVGNDEIHKSRSYKFN